MEITVEGIRDRSENSLRAVAWALRHAADTVERGETTMHRMATGAAPNVVSLRGGDFDCVKPQEPDPGLVKAMADVFRMVRDGKVKSFVGTGFTFDGDRVTVTGGQIGADVYQMLGAIHWLGHEYVDRITGKAAPSGGVGA